MWENFQRLKINRDHAIVIHRSSRPGDWFGAGEAFLAPLVRKRAILIERSKWVYAWTLYNSQSDTSMWVTPPASNPAMHFKLEIKTRTPSGWYFVLPVELRAKGWLPEGGGVVFVEWMDSELTIWTEAAYNEETILEADSKAL